VILLAHPNPPRDERLLKRALLAFCVVITAKPECRFCKTGEKPLKTNA
jgi:hypothetical protein